MSDDTLRGEASTDERLHSDLLSGATTASRPATEPPPRSLSKISIPPQVGRLIPGHQLGRYELLCPIARGGMASVWVARLQGAHGFEKLVALKTILAEHASDPAYEAMFLDEARIVAGIRHHNVAEILDLGSTDSMLYLVLEWVEGDSLALLERAALRHKAPIPPNIAMRIVAQMCAGLHAAHELSDRSGKRLNVVHRDVSPQNVIVSATGEVKLIDFGIAKAVDQLSEHTRTGVLKGKISFMSPEQALGQRVDRRADVWAAGVVLYQLLAGRLPFRGENQLETLHLISRRERAPAIVGLAKPLQQLLDRVLEPELDQRIASAAELEVELERLIGLLGPVTTRDVAAVVQKHLGRRIAARRDVVETALRAADGRIKLSQAFNAALERDRLPDDEASAIAKRREVTTALDASAGNTLALAAASPPAPPPILALGPRRERQWLPALVAVAGLAVLGSTLLLSGGESAAPSAPLAPADQLVPAPESPSTLEPTDAVPQASWQAGPGPVSPDALALEETPAPPTAKTAKAPRPAGRTSVAPPRKPAPAAAPAIKRDVMEAFAERR